MAMLFYYLAFSLLMISEVTGQKAKIYCEALLDDTRNTSNFYGQVFCVKNGTASAVIRVALDGHREKLGIPFPTFVNATNNVNCYVVSDCYAKRVEARKFCAANVGQLVQASTNEQKQAISDISLISSPLSRFYYTDIIAGQINNQNAWVYESTGQAVPNLGVPAPTANDKNIVLVYLRSLLAARFVEKRADENGYFICQTKVAVGGAGQPASTPKPQGEKKEGEKEEGEKKVGRHVHHRKPASAGQIQSRSIAYKGHSIPSGKTHHVQPLQLSSKIAQSMCRQVANLDPMKRNHVYAKIPLSHFFTDNGCGWYQRKQCGGRSCFGYSSKCGGLIQQQRAGRSYGRANHHSSV